MGNDPSMLPAYIAVGLSATAFGFALYDRLKQPRPEEYTKIRANLLNLKSDLERNLSFVNPLNVEQHAVFEDAIGLVDDILKQSPRRIVRGFEDVLANVRIAVESYMPPEY